MAATSLLTMLKINARLAVGIFNRYRVLSLSKTAHLFCVVFQDLFFRIHPIHFLNSRAYGIGVGRSQSPSRERDNIFGFSTGSRRISELTGSEQGPLPWEQNLYVSEPSSDGALEELLEHAQDVSLWVAVEICSASSVKVNSLEELTRS